MHFETKISENKFMECRTLTHKVEFIFRYFSFKMHTKYKPLKNRTNIILSTILTSVHGAFVFDSIESCDRYLNYHYKNWQTKIRYVIGGADIYNQYIAKTNVA